jgi:hypothetical protein
MRKYLIVALLFAVTSLVAQRVSAQDSPSKNGAAAKVEGRSDDKGFDVRVKGGTDEQKQRNTRGEANEKALPGPQGPAGAPGAQGPSGPAGAASGTFLGMDPTVALFIGLGVFAIVVIAIVAASRGGSRHPA